MKLRELFKKVEAYNELAEIMNTFKAHIWFADKTFSTSAFGYPFATYAGFRKYIRCEYIKEVADAILSSDDWQINNEKEIRTQYGKTLTFEIGVNND